MSLDGHIDRATGPRLILSGEADLARVDAVRATADAILIGAGTLRKDNPRLLVRSEALRADRVRRGLPESPLKVVLASHDLDPSARFFTLGGAGKLVYCPSSSAERLRSQVGHVATVVGLAEPLELRAILDDLWTRGVKQLMVEGGGSIHTQFLSAGLYDELQLVVAPFFVGDPAAPRFVGSGTFPFDSEHRMTLLEARAIDDVVLLRYQAAGVYLVSAQTTATAPASAP